MACVERIKKELSKLLNVKNAEVSLNPPQAEITMSKHIDTDELNSAVKKAGKYFLEETDNKIAEQTVLNPFATEEETTKLKAFMPLIIIFIYLMGFVSLSEIHRGEFNFMLFMSNFMGGFFVIFSFFKFLNLQGFADAYSMYDVVAKKWYSYGFIYPFIELFLGVSYLYGLFPKTTNIITLLVMLVSSIGVIQSVLKKNKIQCACLGTVFNLPMTTVTIIEDLLMVIMSTIMLFY